MIIIGKFQIFTKMFKNAWKLDLDSEEKCVAFTVVN